MKRDETRKKKAKQKRNKEHIRAVTSIRIESDTFENDTLTRRDE
jgi:hypothetical protein